MASLWLDNGSQCTIKTTLQRHEPPGWLAGSTPLNFEWNEISSSITSKLTTTPRGLVIGCLISRMSRTSIVAFILEFTLRYSRRTTEYEPSCKVPQGPAVMQILSKPFAKSSMATMSIIFEWEEFSIDKALVTLNSVVLLTFFSLKVHLHPKSHLKKATPTQVRSRPLILVQRRSALRQKGIANLGIKIKCKWNECLTITSGLAQNKGEHIEWLPEKGQRNEQTKDSRTEKWIISGLVTSSCRRR